MYLAHFGLKEHPFELTPDTTFFLAYESYQEALNTLLVAARNGEGFIKITGEVGTGKTLLCRIFLSSLGEDFITAYIPNPYLDPPTLLLAMAGELGIRLERTVDQHKLLRALTLALLGFARENKRVILCIDEAQAMPVETLEAVRLVTNIETEKRKLLQVVLFGQPELDSKLQDHSVRQLNQRITFQHQLGPLQRDEMVYYLNHRLSVAGYRGGQLFTGPAITLLHRVSHGIPRLVNILANKALMVCYGEGRLQVNLRHVWHAYRDTPSAHKLLSRRTKIVMAALLAGLAAGLVWWKLRP